MQYSDTLSFWWQKVTTHNVYVEEAVFFLDLLFKLPVCLVFDSLVLRSSRRWLSRMKTRLPQTVLLSYNIVFTCPACCKGSSLSGLLLSIQPWPTTSVVSVAFSCLEISLTEI